MLDFWKKNYRKNRPPEILNIILSKYLLRITRLYIIVECRSDFSFYGQYMFAIMLLNAFVKSFGKDGGWTVGLIFVSFIFYPMLAWGDAQYQYGDFENGGLAVEDHLVD